MAARGKRGGRIIILLALLLIVILGAVYVYIQFLRPNSVSPTDAVPTPAPAQQLVDIVITTQNIPRGAEITEGAVMTIQYPKENLVEGTLITDLQSVIGRKVKQDMPPGVPLTEASLLELFGGSIASFDIPKDYVAVPIPISALTSVSYVVAAGDHVMVIGCMKLIDIDPEFQSALPNSINTIYEPKQNYEGLSPVTAGVVEGSAGSVQGRTQLDATLNIPFYVIPSEPQRPRLVCQTVIQDAVILRVGDYVEPKLPTPTPVEGEEAAPVQEEVYSPPERVTLVVSPQDAVALNYMLLSEMYLNLALRNPTDTNPIVTDAVTQQYLMDQKNIPLPAKLPYAIEPINPSLLTEAFAE